MVVAVSARGPLRNSRECLETEKRAETVGIRGSRDDQGQWKYRELKMRDCSLNGWRVSESCHI